MVDRFLVEVLYIMMTACAAAYRATCGRSESDDVTGQSTGKSIFCL